MGGLVGGVGQVIVQTTDNRGNTPEEITSRCVAKIINISASANPIIRQQAEEYRKDMARVIEAYIREAAQNERGTIVSQLMQAGETRLAEQIRRI